MSNYYDREHLLSMAMESIAECVSITDENNIILYVNRAFLKVYGYEEKEVVGKHINAFRKEPMLQSVDFILDNTKKGGWRGEIINIRKDGEEFPVMLSTSIITDHDGKYLGLIGVAVDITERKLAEEAYRVLVDHSIQGLLLLVNGRIIFANDRAAEILGYNTDNLVQWMKEDFIRLFHPMDRKHLQEILTQVNEPTVSISDFEYRIMTFDEEQKWIQLSVSNLSFRGGSAVQIAFIDITLSKTAQIGFNRIYKQVQKQNLVFEELLRSDLSDYTGSLAKITTAAAQNMNVDYMSIWLFNEDETKLTCIDQYNKKTDTHFSGISLDYVSNPEYFAALEETRIISVSNVFLDPRTKGYTDYFSHYDINALLDVKIGYGKGFSGVVSFEDGQNPRFWQEDEIAFAVRIVDIVSFLMEAYKRNLTEIALRESEKKLRELVYTKDRFFSILAHDLKNPFHAIAGFSDLLRRDYEKFTVEERKSILENIHRSADNTSILFEDLLEWSGTFNGSLIFNPENNELKKIVEDVIRFLEPQAFNKGIQLQVSYDGPTIAWFDRGMIKTVIRNLMTNAISFSYPGGNVDVLVTRTDIDGENRIKITVSDQGVGISSTNQEHLFILNEKFHTEGTGGEKGTGFGLILCKDLVEMNQGKIWVESEEGKGSRFHFLLLPPQ